MSASLWETAQPTLRGARGYSGLSITATPAGGRRIRVSGTERVAIGEAPGPTGVAAPVAHVCRNEAPLVCGWVVELHGRQIAGPIVSADHVQQPVNGAHALRRSTAVSETATEEDSSKRRRMSWRR